MPTVERGVPSGTRDRLITVQELVESFGPTNFPVDDWTTLCQLWVSYETSTSQSTNDERFSGGQLSAPFETTWHLPYRADLDPDLVPVAKTRRLLYRGRQYDIVTAVCIGRQEEIRLTTLARMG